MNGLIIICTIYPAPAASLCQEEMLNEFLPPAFLLYGPLTVQYVVTSCGELILLLRIIVSYYYSLFLLIDRLAGPAALIFCSIASSLLVSDHRASRPPAPVSSRHPPCTMHASSHLSSASSAVVLAPHSRLPAASTLLLFLSDFRLLQCLLADFSSSWRRRSRTTAEVDCCQLC